jgi:hypothetical protein
MTSLKVMQHNLILKLWTHSSCSSWISHTWILSVKYLTAPLWVYCSTPRWPGAVRDPVSPMVKLVPYEADKGEIKNYRGAISQPALKVSPYQIALSELFCFLWIQFFEGKRDGVGFALRGLGQCSPPSSPSKPFSNLFFSLNLKLRNNSSSLSSRLLGNSSILSLSCPGLDFLPTYWLCNFWIQMPEALPRLWKHGGPPDYTANSQFNSFKN